MKYIALLVLFLSVQVIAQEKRYSIICWQQMPENISLEDAVTELNRRAMQNEIGKTQPPLTVDEVIANIRGITDQLNPMSREARDAFLLIEKTGTLHHGVSLDFCSGWRWEDRKIDVWWVDIGVNMDWDDFSYEAYRKRGSIRMRDLTLRSKLIEVDGEDKAHLALTHAEIADQARLRELSLIAKTRPDGLLTEQEWTELNVLMRKSIENIEAEIKVNQAVEPTRPSLDVSYDQ